jgi:hypothetical protein
LMGPKEKPAAPPPVQMPATPAPTSRKPEAEVRVGDGVDPTNPGATPDYNPFAPRRASGKSLGGLGRGGLGL